MENGNTLRRNRRHIRDRVEHENELPLVNQEEDTPVETPANGSNAEVQNATAPNAEHAEVQNATAPNAERVVTKSGRIVKLPARYCDEVCVHESDVE